MAQMKPFPRTADMQEKMATFRDAGRYEQDAHIDFEPYEHIYIYWVTSSSASIPWQQQNANGRTKVSL